MPADGQQDHWNRIYSGNPSFFGGGSSEFARGAAELFRREGVRSILEPGCGQGRDALFFAAEGFHVTGLDYSEAGLAELRESAMETGASGRIATRVFDVRKPLPFPDGSFDACYSHMLLCMELSKKELGSLLGEIRRVLNPGGILLYSVRNTFDKQYGSGTHKSEGMYEIPGGFVVHFFSEEMVRQLAAGWEIVELQRMREGNLPKELFRVVARNRAMP